MTTHKHKSWSVLSFLLLVVLLMIPALAIADCLKDGHGKTYCGTGRCKADSTGTAWCSKYFEGDAERMPDGKVVCGKGQCMKGSDGSVICSTETSGSVIIDGNGNVRCDGQCEPASVENCETARASM